MTAPEGHRDVAAHALGVLEPLDALRCAEHLTVCPGCAGEHEEFVRLAAREAPGVAVHRLGHGESVRVKAAR